jgi:hypothetical protein
MLGPLRGDYWLCAVDLAAAEADCQAGFGSSLSETLLMQ